jgi:uncharacterized protein YqhQ
VTDNNASAAAQAAPIQHTHIGGQAVLEGVMMRGKYNWAIAVREADDNIHVEEHDLATAVSKKPWLGKPVVRGVVAFYETMVLAMQAFSISAQYAGGLEEEERLSAKEISMTMVFGIGLAILLFIVAPAFLTNALVGKAIERPFVWNVVDGLLRVAAFFLYIWAISRMKDIQRVFGYHGAEHKTIHAFEHDLPLEPDVIQRYETMHVRCGTSFLLMVMIIALVVYSLVPMKAILGAMGLSAGWAVTLFAVLIRILLLPVIAGLAYEVIKWAGRKPDNGFVRVILWPGLQLQRMTTRQPDDGMIEVAVAAMQPVIAREQREAGVVAEVAEAAPVPPSAGQQEEGGEAADA